MSIKIGERTLATRRPADMDAALVAATGCAGAEVATLLRGHPLAGHVAAALHPFLTGTDAPDVATLATLIAEAGTTEIAAKVADLLAISEDDPAKSGGKAE